MNIYFMAMERIFGFMGKCLNAGGNNSRLLVLSLMLMLFTSVSAQTIRYVKQGGTGDGLSWATASGSIKATVLASVANDQVWVAEGSFAEFNITPPHGIKIYGGFPASGNPTMADRNSAIYVTSISVSNNAYGFIYNNGLAAASVVDGFSLSGGTSTTGIRCNNSSPSFTNIQIKCGTGFQLAQSNSSLTNILVTDGYYGVTIANASPILTNVTLVKNSLYDIYAFSTSSTINVKNSIIGSISNLSYVTLQNSITNVSLYTTFVEPDAGDYTLLVNGPAVNAGDSTLYINAAAAKDLGGNARLSGGQIDMGAYESLAQQGNNIRYVKQGGVGDGSSWASASGNLQQMINESAAGQHVWVAAGTYQPQMSFNMKDGVKIYGGFPDTGNPIFSQRNWVTNTTILTGSPSGAVIRNVVPLTSNSLLDGFTITGGNGLYGGGIQNEQSSPNFKNLIVKNNTAIQGGGIYVYGGNPTIKNVTVKSNSASFGGGSGVLNAETTAKYINVQITDNTNEGLRNMYSNISLFNCTITNNTGIQLNNMASNPTIKNSIVCGSGTISNTSSIPLISNSLIQGSGGSSAWINTYGVNNGGNKDAEPNFIDSLNNNYSLLPCSAAVNAGSDAVFSNIAVEKDLAGNPRKYGMAVDMGVYEYQGESGVPSPVAQTNQTHNYGATVADLTATGTDLKWYNVAEGGTPLPAEEMLVAGTYYVTQFINGCFESAPTAVQVVINYPVLYVKPLASGTGDGSSWANASADLQAMILQQQPGQQVWVAAGTYSPAAGESFNMKSRVDMYGGFPATGNPGMAARNYHANPVILAGNGTSVIKSVNFTDPTILNGFIISGGSATGDGGGIYNSNANINIVNCIVRNNTATGTGGGLYSGWSNVKVKNSLFYNNTAQTGGGVATVASSSELVNVTIADNFAVTAAGYYQLSGYNYVFNNIVRNNNASGPGPGKEFLNVSNDGIVIIHGIMIDNAAGNNSFGNASYSGIINADPLFTDPASGDYSLLPCSPAKNTGVQNWNGMTNWFGDQSLENDLSGQPRLNGQIDIGAYEYYGAETLAAVTTAPSPQVFDELSTVGNLVATGQNVKWYTAAQGGEPLASYAPVYSGTYYASNGCQITRIPVTVIGNYSFPVRYVKQVATGDASGSSWDNASADLQAMINISELSYEVWVAEGIYSMPYYQSFKMKHGVKIYGGFPGEGSPQMESRNVTGHPTTLLGMGRSVIDNANNNLTSTSLLDGFIIQGGTDYNGGGIRNINSFPTIANCIFRYNEASNWGGGIYNEGSGSTKVINCLFYGNTASGGGAAFDNNSANPVYTNTTFANNNSTVNGGAIHTYQSAQATLQNCIVWGNTAASDGDQLISAGGGSVVSFNTLIPVAVSDINGPFTSTNTIAGDPLFTNAGLANFTLQTGSPAINTANASLLPGSAGLKDLNGNIRLFDSYLDLGAFEYQSITPCGTFTTWNGTAWSNGEPTSYGYAAVIEGDYNSAADGEITACSLTVNSGDVVIAPEDAFVIKGPVNIEGGILTVENFGSLIQEDDVENTGNITFIRNSNLLYKLDYTSWSSPVAGQNLQAFSPATLPNRFYIYGINANGNEAFLLANANGSFSEGKGYHIRMPDQLPAPDTEAYNTGTLPYVHEGIFTGVPHNGTVEVPMSVSGNHFSLVGNPYPSPINVVELFTENAAILSPVHGIYFWRKRNNAEASSYATLNMIAYTANDGGLIENTDGVFNDINNYGGQQWENYFGLTTPEEWTIAAGQGFFVAGNGTGGNLKFTNMMRTTALDGQPYFRSNPQAQPHVSRIWLNLNSGGNFSQIAVAYTQGATPGLDFGLDSKQFSNSNISLYSLAEEENLAIQARPEFESTDVVPLGYSVQEADTYSISLHRKDGLFNDGQLVYLKDKLLGITHDFSEGQYQFVTESGTFDTRFEVVYTDDALSIHNPGADANNIIVYKKNTNLHINSGKLEMATVRIFDIRGRIIYERGEINATDTLISDLHIEQEIIILQVTTVEGIITSQKIVF